MPSSNQSAEKPAHYSVAHFSTAEAAHLLLRRAQTLRKWSCQESGPISPVRVGGRLLWRRSDIEALLAGEKAAA